MRSWTKARGRLRDGSAWHRPIRVVERIRSLRLHGAPLLTLALLPAALCGCGVGRAVYAGTGYDSKILASAIFVSGRAEQDVLDVDLALGPLGLITPSVDREARSVTARLLRMAPSKVICRSGLGCTLIRGFSEDEIRSQPIPAWRPLRDLASLPWPTGDGPFQATGPASVDRGQLAEVLDLAFSEPKRAGTGLRGTRAVVVVHRGRIVAERYAKGFDASMPLLGWSMTKALTHALVGIRVRQSKLDIHAPAPVPEWRGEGDPRGAITTDMLLRMSSGLEFRELYDEYASDVVQMLYGSGDVAGFAAAKPLAHEPDTDWQYSSGTTNIVSRILRSTFDGDQGAYLRFPRTELFARIGMRSAVFEPDASGTFVGSSYLYASARDWARLGLLYLNDGVWEGERLLPKGWVRYATTPTPGAPHGQYGAHWWLNAGTPGDPSDRAWPELPVDAYAAEGFEGQYLMIIPSHDLVIVRLGISRPESTFRINDFAAAILSAIGRSE